MLNPRSRVLRRAGRSGQTPEFRVRTIAVCSLLAGVALASGCAEPLRVQTHPGLRDLEEPIRNIAVLPFRPTGSLPKQRDPAIGPEPRVAAKLVARHVGEALNERGVGVVPAEDTARVLGLEGGVTERMIPRAVAQRVAAEFGADAVLLGDVWRYQERSGRAAGTRQPASIGFEVVLYAAPSGRKLWSSVFDETQHALSENLLTAGRYPGGGTRWLTAEEMLRWGATETANAVPLGN